MEFLVLLGKTLILRSYVFLFLGVALTVAVRLMGFTRTAVFFFTTWIVAFVCEFSSTRTGIPFGWYFYNDSTRGQELYISNVPIMDSLSFTFLLFASYCVSIILFSSRRLSYDLAIRTSPRILAVSTLLFMLIDVVIDPVALRGDRWFLGKIYEYPQPGLHFGVPLMNYVGWAVVGVIALGLYQQIDRRMRDHPARQDYQRMQANLLLVGGALYYVVLAFNLAMTFWIGEWLLGWSGILLFLPLTAVLLVKLMHMKDISPLMQTLQR
jgi:uncharacterized membrane protein